MNTARSIGDKVYFTFEGVRFRAKLGRGYSDVKTRIFVDLPEDAGDSIVDRFIKRDRGGKNPELKARQKASRGLVLAALEALELDTKGVKYSRYAGCSACSCSPGFIFTECLGYSISVTSVEELRARKDASMAYAVESAKEDVKDAKQAIKDAKQAIKKAEREQAKAERNIETTKAALTKYKAKRREQKKTARAKARAAAKVAA